MSTTTVGIHVATVRQFDPITGIATVVIPSLYGDTAIESRPFLSSPEEAAALPVLDPGDTVIAFYDGGDSTTVLRWYLTGGHGVGAVAPTSWPVVLYTGTSWPARGGYPTNMPVLWVNHYDQTKPPVGGVGAVVNVDIVFVVDPDTGTGAETGLPPGGTRMQVVSKNSTANGDASWRDPTWLVSSRTQPGASDYGLTTIPYGALWVVMPT